MEISGSYFSSKDWHPDTANNPAPAPKLRLEDLLNDLISMNAVDATSNKYEDILASSMEKTENPLTGNPEGILLSERKPVCKNIDSKKNSALAASVRAELNLPAGSEAIFKTLKSFHQHNRHKPIIEFPNGRIYYVDFDAETDRIRVFLGSSAAYVCLRSGGKRDHAYMVVDELFEFKREECTKTIMGFTTKDNLVIERFRSRRDLLNRREAEEGSIMPVLHISIYPEKGSGLSESSFKTESFRT